MTEIKESRGERRRQTPAEEPMLNRWKTERLAAVAGVLCRDYPHVSRFEIVRLVCRLASFESPRMGGVRLLHHAREAIYGVVCQRTSDAAVMTAHA